LKIVLIKYQLITLDFIMLAKKLFVKVID